MRTRDRFGGREPGTDQLSPARKPGKIMKAHAADQNYVIVFGQCSIQFNGYAAGGFAETYDLHKISRIMVKRLDPLGDERRQDRRFFGVGHFAVYARRENDAYFKRNGAVGYQPSDDKIDDLAAGSLPRRVRDDDQDRFAGIYYLFELRRIDRVVEFLANLYIG